MKTQQQKYEARLQKAGIQISDSSVRELKSSYFKLGEIIIQMNWEADGSLVCWNDNCGSRDSYSLAQLTGILRKKGIQI